MQIFLHGIEISSYYGLTISDENHIMEGLRKKCERNRGQGMSEQKKPSVRDVLWRKKRARDRVLDAVGKLCDEAWAIFERIAEERSSSSRDAVTAREMSLRLRSLAYLIEGEHYIDRIAFELRTKEVYLTANEVARAYISEMVIAYLDAILLYGRQCQWDSQELHDEYHASLEKSLEEIRQSLLSEAAPQADDSADD